MTAEEKLLQIERYMIEGVSSMIKVRMRMLCSSNEYTYPLSKETQREIKKLNYTLCLFCKKISAATDSITACTTCQEEEKDELL